MSLVAVVVELRTQRLTNQWTFSKSAPKKLNGNYQFSTKSTPFYPSHLRFLRLKKLLEISLFRASFSKFPVWPVLCTSRRTKRNIRWRNMNAEPPTHDADRFCSLKLPGERSFFDDVIPSAFHVAIEFSSRTSHSLAHSERLPRSGKSPNENKEDKFNFMNDFPHPWRHQNNFLFRMEFFSYGFLMPATDLAEEALDHLNGGKSNSIRGKFLSFFHLVMNCEILEAEGSTARWEFGAFTIQLITFADKPTKS